MKKELIGNWFLCRTGDDHLFITKDKPEKVESIKSFVLRGTNKISGWLSLDRIGGSRFSVGAFQSIKREDFLCLDFPEVTYEDSPLEIEIMPSGKVYFYES